MVVTGPAKVSLWVWWVRKRDPEVLRNLDLAAGPVISGFPASAVI